MADATTGLPSKSIVDKAGGRLRKWLTSSDGILGGSYDPIHDFQILSDWRAQFEGPMQATTVGLRSAVNTRCPAAPLKVKRRFKREQQILSKLVRMSIRLSQMEDIAGCRAVLPSMQDVRAVQSQLERAARKLDVRTVDDYVANVPEKTGYRAVHLHGIRDGMRVEIQLRTERQHQWAEQVEEWDDAFGFDLKHGHGPDLVLEYFRVRAMTDAALDSGQDVPSHLVRELDNIRDKLRRVIARGELR